MMEKRVRPGRGRARLMIADFYGSAWPTTRDRPIGSFDDFYADVRQYLLLLRRINEQLPYPDDANGPLEKY